MKYDKTNDLLARAFDVVRKYDPDTYAMMKDEDWNVSTWLDEAFPEYWTMVLQDPESPGALGITLSSDFPGIFIPQPQTFLNPGLIHMQAKNTGANPILLAAEVLVHEFKHRHGAESNDKIFAPGGEYQASVEGKRFAHLLAGLPNSEPVIKFADDNLRMNS